MTTLNEYDFGFLVGCLVIIIAAFIGIVIGTSKWLDKLMHKIGEWIDGQR